MRTRWLALTVVMMSAPVLTLDAQLAELQPGTRVRLRAPASVAGQLTGMVVARMMDSVTVTRPNAAPVAIPLRALTALDISRGKSRSRGAWKGTLWGGGIGLALGAIPFSDTPCKDGQFEPNCERISAQESTVLSVIGGALIGAVIGTAVGVEHWERATLPPTVTLAPTPGGRGVQVGVRVAMLQMPR